MAAALERQIAQCNGECRDECAKVTPTSSGKQLLVAICTPLMNRVHAQLKHSREMCFMDGLGSWFAVTSFC